MAEFSSLGLSDWLVKQCQQLGINKPTPVQENCVPAILQGEFIPRDNLIITCQSEDLSLKGRYELSFD